MQRPCAHWKLPHVLGGAHLERAFPERFDA
jgi:hypothetical protein